MKYRRAWVFAVVIVAVAMTPAVAAAQSDVTFTKDVAPILYNSCVVCHRAGEMAPMALDCADSPETPELNAPNNVIFFLLRSSGRRSGLKTLLSRSRTANRRPLKIP